MGTITELVSRVPVPEPWSEGDKIPWHEPEFSARMLREHLSQAHDLASRRAAVIDEQVAWLAERLLTDGPARVLDLGCGPGLYASRLARRGHTCHGLDFGPASIAYARETAAREGLACTFELADLRDAEFGSGYDLVMMLFGEFNVFRPAEAMALLRQARGALCTGGRLVLEVTTLDGVRRIGEQAPSWTTHASGLFAEQPHLLLHESFWCADRRVATERFHVIDAATAAVASHAASTQGYTADELRQMLAESGFSDSRPDTWPTGGPELDGYFELVVAEV